MKNLIHIYQYELPNQILPFDYKLSENSISALLSRTPIILLLNSSLKLKNLQIYTELSFSSIKFTVNTGDLYQTSYTAREIN